MLFQCRNNAGVAAGGGVDTISIDSWRWVVDVNLMGVVYGVRSFLPHMRAQMSGHIIQVSSIAGITAFPDLGLYSASKWGFVRATPLPAYDGTREAIARIRGNIPQGD